MIETKYLILSIENQCVFTMTRDPVVANALCSSDINTVIRPITRYNFNDFDKINNRDYFKDKIYKSEFRDKFLSEVDVNLISQVWKDERESMRYKQDALTLLEVHYLSAITPAETAHNINFSNEAWQEIMLCDIEKGLYTRYIEEYSRILDKPIDQVYRELKLKIEGEKFIRFRVSALVERWKIKINEIKNHEDFIKVRDDMVNEFWVKSQI